MIKVLCLCVCVKKKINPKHLPSEIYKTQKEKKYISSWRSLVGLAQRNKMILCFSLSIMTYQQIPLESKIPALMYQALHLCLYLGALHVC